ncbi:replication/maintenance protein RepL [Bacillus seohaeanensis]|uniref:Replication/maintenance protein RepL n=1 Tax=Bacillus seohaeanensis TaxID=284580 RepID=A0ABW5RLH2_9BACI
MSKRRRKTKNNYWGAIILEWFHYLRDSDFTSLDYRVLFFLCERMKSDDNTTYLKQKQIAEELNSDKGNISKSIKKLRDKQFIVKSQNGFMINPHLFYVGKPTLISREEIREEFDDLLSEEIRFSFNEEDRKLEEYPNQD